MENKKVNSADKEVIKESIIRETELISEIHNIAENISKRCSLMKDPPEYLSTIETGVNYLQNAELELIRNISSQLVDKCVVLQQTAAKRSNPKYKDLLDATVKLYKLLFRFQGYKQMLSSFEAEALYTEIYNCTHVIIVCTNIMGYANGGEYVDECRETKINNSLDTIFVKEDLPTWDELYNEFYLKEVCTNDPYNILCSKTVFMQSCNWLNYRMCQINESSELHNEIFTEIQANWDKLSPLLCIPESVDLSNSHIKKIWFELSSTERIINSGYKEISNDCLSTDDNSILDHIKIYTLKKDGDPNPFILNKSNRKFITPDSLSVLNWIIAIIEVEGESHQNIVRVITSQANNHNIYIFWNNLMKIMLKDIIDYYEGEGIGWKDSEGHLLNSSHQHIGHDNCDPVL